MEKGINKNGNDENVVAVNNSAAKGDFSVGSVRRQIISLALPMTLAQLINLLYSIVDRMYLGRMADGGSLALTGVGLVIPIVSILMSVAGLCGTGGAPLFSIARGRGDDEEAGKILGNSFALLVLLGAAMTIGVIVFQRPILYAFGTSDATYPYASQYLSIYMLGTLFVMISLGMNSFINAQGAAKRGMMTVALGAIVNIVLDPIFIFALNMGVRGAALATIIAQGCSAVWVLIYLTGKSAVVKLRLEYLRLSARRVGQIVALGLSGFVMNLTNSLIQIICNKTLATYGGDLFIGVMTVVNAVREIVFMPVQGINSGATPVMGYNYGAGEDNRLRTAIRFSMTLTVGYTFVVWVAIMLVPQLFAGLFSKEAELITAAVRSMRLYYAMSVFMALQMTSQGVFVALGKSKQAVFFSLLRKAFIAAPLTVLLPRFVLGGTALGVDGVFLADTVSQLLGGLACGSTMYFTLYRKLEREPKVVVTQRH